MTDYTKNSYDDNVAQLTENLKSQEGWGEGYDSSMGSMLIRLHADATDNLMYMLFRRTQERYMATAKTRSAVVALACDLGYLAKRVRANYGNITLTLNGLPQGQGVSEIVVIPENTLFNVDGVDVVTSEEVQFNIGETFVSLPVKAGVFKTQVVPYDDFKDLGYIEIPDYSLWDNDVLQISYGGKEVKFIREDEDGRPSHMALSFVGPEDDYYDIRYVGSTMRIILGDDTFGKRPTSDITIRYLEVDIESSEVVGQAVEATGNLVLVGSDTGDTYEWQAVTDGRISYGSEEESIESIKNNAMAYTRSNGRAITADDTEFWVKESGIGGIVDVGVFGEQELKTFVVNANKITINYLTSDGLELTVDEQVALRKYLDAVLCTTVHPVITPVKQLKVGVNVDVVKPVGLQMANSEFYDTVKGIIEDEFKIEEGSIGKTVEHSELVAKIQNYEFTRNGVNRQLVDYLKLEMACFYEIDETPRAYVHRVSIDPNRPLGTSGFISLVADGKSYNSQYSNSNDNIRVLTNIESSINGDPDQYLKAIFNFQEEYLEISSESEISDFTLVTQGVDPINQYIRIDSRIDLPKTETTIGVTNTSGIYSDGDVTLVDVNGETVATYDKALNQFINTVGTQIGGSIDFANGYVWKPSTLSNDVVIKYHHDKYGNMKTSKQAALILKEFSDDYLTPNKFSKIQIGTGG